MSNSTPDSPKVSPRVGLFNKIRDWLKTYGEDNPQSYVAAHRAAGGILIADALVGLENPFDGVQTRPGIWGRIRTLVPILGFAILWLAVTSFMGGAIESPTATEPTKATVVSTKDSDGACYISYEFTPKGESLRESTTGYGSSSFCKYRAGDTIDILYDPNQTSTTSVASDSSAGIVKGMRYGPPLVIALIAIPQIFGILFGIAEIIFGIILLRHASKYSRENLPEGYDTTDLVAEAKEQLIPMVMLAKSGMRGAKRMFVGGAPDQAHQAQWQQESQAPKSGLGSLLPGVLGQAAGQLGAKPQPQPGQINQASPPPSTLNAPPSSLRSTPSRADDPLPLVTSDDAADYAEYKAFKDWQKNKNAE